MYLISVYQTSIGRHYTYLSEVSSNIVFLYLLSKWGQTPVIIYVGPALDYEMPDTYQALKDKFEEERYASFKITAEEVENELGFNPFRD